MPLRTLNAISTGEDGWEEFDALQQVTARQPLAPGEQRNIYRCRQCHHLHAHDFIPYGLGEGRLFGFCRCGVINPRYWITNQVMLLAELTHPLPPSCLNPAQERSMTPTPTTAPRTVNRTAIRRAPGETVTLGRLLPRDLFVFPDRPAVPYMLVVPVERFVEQHPPPRVTALDLDTGLYAYHAGDTVVQRLLPHEEVVLQNHPELPE